MNRYRKALDQRFDRRTATQSGVYTVEFAIIGVALFAILFGAIEMSRLLFTWNALDAITQRAARIAAICPIGSDVAKQLAAFNADGGDGGIVPGLTNDNIQIVYLNKTVLGNYVEVTARPISFVRASIVNYQHEMAIPFIPDRIIGSPTFETTIPAESLGFVPNTGGYTC